MTVGKYYDMEDEEHYKDALIAYHLKSPPRLTPEEQAAEDTRVLEERYAWLNNLFGKNTE